MEVERKRGGTGVEGEGRGDQSELEEKEAGALRYNYIDALVDSNS